MDPRDGADMGMEPDRYQDPLEEGNESSLAYEPGSDGADFTSEPGDVSKPIEAVDQDLVEELVPLWTPPGEPELVEEMSETLAFPSEELGSIIEAMARLEASLEGRLEGLRSLFEREVRAESSRERIVDRLHAELQEYKNDFVLKLLKPIFLDLILLHDELGKREEPNVPAEGAGTMAFAREIQQAIEDILYRQGVEPFREQGIDFDPKRQRSISTVVCDDPNQARTIARRVRPGFESEGKVIRPELVSVYVGHARGAAGD
jgi:molecular chaperone GrpE